MRILVADDEKDMALVLQAILEHQRHTVDVAYDGRAALDFARTGELAAISNLTAISGAVMGLSIARSVAERHGGRISARKVGGDLEIRVALPRARASEA